MGDPGMDLEEDHIRGETSTCGKSPASGNLPAEDAKPAEIYLMNALNFPLNLFENTLKKIY